MNFSVGIDCSMNRIALQQDWLVQKAWVAANKVLTIQMAYFKAASSRAF